MQIINKKIIGKIKNKGINFITIDGITCSGKSIFADLLMRELKKKNKNIQILSKDLFLLPREKRIKLTKRKIKNKNFYLQQNKLHYDQKKLKLLFKHFSKKSYERFKPLTITKLYDRKTGKNTKMVKFKFKQNSLVIFEGLYVNDDIKKIKKPLYKILLVEKIYESLARKIERIRDKKISIQHVVTEFTKIHLQSFKKHLVKNDFDITFKDLKRDFITIQNGKKKQLDYIRLFLSKHLY